MSIVPTDTECLDPIPVGRYHRLIPSVATRTREQRAAIFAITRCPDFDFACMNPLATKLAYTGPLTFTWYDHAGGIHFTLITSAGRIVP